MVLNNCKDGVNGVQDSHGHNRFAFHFFIFLALKNFAKYLCLRKIKHWREASCRLQTSGSQHKDGGGRGCQYKILGPSTWKSKGPGLLSMPLAHWLRSFHHIQLVWPGSHTRPLSLSARRQPGGAVPPPPRCSAPFRTIQEHLKGRTGKENTFDLCFWCTKASSGNGVQAAKSSFGPFQLSSSPHLPPFTWFMEPDGSAGHGLVKQMCPCGRGAKSLGARLPFLKIATQLTASDGLLVSTCTTLTSQSFLL